MFDMMTVGKVLMFKEREMAKKALRYWIGSVGEKDDFGRKIEKVFYDGATDMGPWAIMTPESWRQHGQGVGLGRGQKYEKQEDGRWLKVEG
jgi:hypothetical protein